MTLEASTNVAINPCYCPEPEPTQNKDMCSKCHGLIDYNSLNAKKQANKIKKRAKKKTI